MMRKIVPNETNTKDLHQFLLACVSPRPIAFVSTVDNKGRKNLAPYSFFNAFSSNPPILVFSSNRRVRDNTTKDTLHNVEETKEVVINMVNYDIVRQMTLASIEFETGVSEFEKSGLTAIPSELIKPFRVKESPAQLECKVKEVISLGEHGGAGHLIICEVLLIHINENVIDENNRVNPHKIDLMGRMGRSYYVRASGEAIHTIVQSVAAQIIGVDQLPKSIRESKFLTGNEIALLGSNTSVPDQKEINKVLALNSDMINDISKTEKIKFFHLKTKEKLQKEQKEEALILAMAADTFSME
jgi:flavin reductase (DIM6/NTAB) family NADH-FMN oxidoreductase RutF